MYLGLEITKEKVYRLTLFGKNMTIFVKSSLFNRNLCNKLLLNNQSQFACHITENDELINGHIKSIDIPSFWGKITLFGSKMKNTLSQNLIKEICKIEPLFPGT